MLAELLARVDHLIYAGPDLDEAVARVESLIGIRATAGGSHPGEGTRNALLALGPSSYLEILGPDPEQPAPQRTRWFRVDELSAPRLVAWAAKSPDLERIAASASPGAARLGRVLAGSRRRPDGVMLSWRLTDPRAVSEGGVIPFLIDWGSSPHPAAGSAPGATLIDLRAEHPEPETAAAALRALGIAPPVVKGPAAGLVARVDCPKGVVELR